MWPFKRKQPTPAEQRQRDYESLGKQVMALYDHINPDRKGLYRTAFLKGIFTGFGGVVGATVIIAIVAWILALVGHIPFLESISRNAQDTIQQSKE